MRNEIPCIEQASIKANGPDSVPYVGWLDQYLQFPPLSSAFRLMPHASC
jgi:hypothetical protein